MHAAAAAMRSPIVKFLILFIGFMPGPAPCPSYDRYWVFILADEKAGGGKIVTDISEGGALWPADW